MKTLIKLVVILAFYLAGNSPAVAQKVAVTPDQLPSDFKDYKDTLLVMDFSVIMGYKKFLHKNFAEYYSGPYRFATRQEYVQGKIRHFRFVFEAAWDYELIGGESKKRIYYVLHDNDKRTHYKTMSTKYYSELMIEYIKKLDSELKIK